jgi:hypothetical protein
LTRFFCLALGLLASCQTVSTLPAPAHRTLIIQHHAAECQGVEAKLCLLVKGPEEGSFSNLHADIGGFEYQWGYVYEIEIAEHVVPNPPADGSSLRRELRKIAWKERVAGGTEFDMFLTALDRRVEEVAPDRYRVDAGYSTAVEFTCPSDLPCGDLREQITTGSRLLYRFRHPVADDEPLTVVRWEVCDPAPVGSDLCTT